MFEYDDDDGFKIEFLHERERENNRFEIMLIYSQQYPTTKH